MNNSKNDEDNNNYNDEYLFIFILINNIKVIFLIE